MQCYTWQTNRRKTGFEKQDIVIHEFSLRRKPRLLAKTNKQLVDAIMYVIEHFWFKINVRQYSPAVLSTVLSPLMVNHFSAAPHTVNATLHYSMEVPRRSMFKISS